MSVPSTQNHSGIDGDVLETKQLDVRDLRTGGLNVDIAAAGGSIEFLHPSHKKQDFRFGSAGMGAGIGLKLPKVGKSEIRPEKHGKAIGGVGAPRAFPDVGSIYMTPFFSGRELAAADLRGLCIVIDGGAGLLVGYSGALMLLGIDPARFAMQIASPIMSLLLSQTELNAVLVTRGLNAGIQAGGGVTGTIGYLA